MPITSTEAKLIRRKTADTATSFPDEDVDLLFDDAESIYSDYSRDVILQAVLVARLEELWTASISSVSYKENESSENLSDIAKMLEKRKQDAETRLKELISKETPVALRTAVMKRIPTRSRTFPDG